jgi:hypothetical protein
MFQLTKAEKTEVVTNCDHLAKLVAAKVVNANPKNYLGISIRRDVTITLPVTR